MQIDISEYYKKYGPMVLRRCRVLLSNEVLAINAMQEVFIELLRNEKKLISIFPSNHLCKLTDDICKNMIGSDQKKMDGDYDEKLNPSFSSRNKNGIIIKI